MDDTEAFGLHPPLSHGGKQIHGASRRIDQSRRAAETQQKTARFDKFVDSSEDLVAGQALFSRRVRPAASGSTIGRIANCDIEAFGCKDSFGRANIGLDNLYPAFQLIEVHASPGPINHFSLDLHTHYLHRRMKDCQDQSDDSIAGPEVNDSLAPLDIDKMSQ